MNKVCAALTGVVVAVLLLSQCMNCATTSKLAMSDVIFSHPAYHTLTNYQKNLIAEICKEIEQKDNKAYYFDKLVVLLDTPYETNKQRLKSRQVTELKESVAIVREASTEDSSEEEEIEESITNGWIKYRPSPNSSYYYVNRDDYLNIYIRIHVHLVGDPEIVQDMYQLEDAVEKHLAVPGFSVNLVWADYEGDDVFTINTNQGEWATSNNWAGDYQTMAHELMHLFGLPDEYNRIDSHAGNKYISIDTRLNWFLIQMRDKTYADAEEGIMWHNWKKPLPRHVCWAAGLGDECIKARTERYGSLHEVSH